MVCYACALYQTMLRAGTVTKRTELLLDQLCIDPNLCCTRPGAMVEGADQRVE